jgi:hypothetical protein
MLPVRQPGPDGLWSLMDKCGMVGCGPTPVDQQPSFGRGEQTQPIGPQNDLDAPRSRLRGTTALSPITTPTQGDRMTRVLVAFASKMGATTGIAEVIGEELLGRGLDVEVREVGEVSSVEGYDCVVLGSAVYAARWQPEAARFFRRHAAGLTGRRVRLFESGWIRHASGHRLGDDLAHVHVDR